jgi:hypothetical protein
MFDAAQLTDQEVIRTYQEQHSVDPAFPSMKFSPLYRCTIPYDHFASFDPNCEGQITESLLGYVVL